MKKLVTIVLLMIVSGLARAQFTNGTGTAGDPYQINNAADLNYVRNYLGIENAGTYFKLMGDIDLTTYLASGGEGYTAWGSAGWLPVGDAVANHEFYGQFDGNNHKVSGLWINRTGTLYIGLFGALKNPAAIQQLGVEIDPSGGVNGSMYVGGLVGTNYGTISHCYVTGPVNGTSMLDGGLAGQNDGYLFSCYATGAVSGSWSVGGLVGYNHSGTITNCYSRGAVSGGNIGGLVGQNDNGGLVSNCYATGLVGGGTSGGGLVANNLSTVDNCFWDRETTGRTTSTGSDPSFGKTTAEMITQSTFSGWDFTSPIWLISGSINNGYPYLSPQIQAASLVFSDLQPYQMTINWTNGNETQRVVFIKQANTGTAIPLNNTIYSPSPVFGSGTQIGSTGWFCVFNNNVGNSVTVTGLSASTDYIVQVFEFIRNGGLEKYNRNVATDNPKSQATPTDCINPTAGGSIAADQSGCSGFDPVEITNTGGPTGENGTIEYKWQSSTDNTNFYDITGANSESYDPEALTETTWFRRLARVNCMSDWTGAVSSNVVQITIDVVTPTITGKEFVCFNEAGVVYTTEAGMSGYSWSVDGGSITSISNTYQITVTWSTSEFPMVSVDYTNSHGCPSLTPGTLGVTVLPLPVPVISGDTIVPVGSTGLVYSTEMEYHDYVWSISAGGVITTVNPAEWVDVNWNVKGDQTISVTYTTADGCRPVTPTVLHVLVRDRIWYVDLTAVGANNGTSWDDAFISFQSALSAAASGDQIWVAKGNYFPSVKVGGTGNRFKTFQMKEGVAIYGGFFGDEVFLDERDITSNVTTLSGDIGIGENMSDNCYHVFYHPANLSPSLTHAAILDGFRIAYGNANSASNPHNSGAGMYNVSNSPKIVNCTFIHNEAYYGAGMRNRSSNAEVTDCYFSNNQAHDGGGVFNSQGTTASYRGCTFENNNGDSGGGVENNASSPLYDSCFITNNSVQTYGGGIQNFGAGSPVFTNCFINLNEAVTGGAGIFNDEGSSATFSGCLITRNSITGTGQSQFGGGVLNNNCTASLINCTVSGNDAGSGAGGGIVTNTSDFTFDNGILWGNTAAVVNEMVNSGTTVFNYSCYSNDPDDIFVNSGTFTATNHNITDDPLFVNTVIDDFRLDGNSPCCDAGDNVYVETPYPVLLTDIRGGAFGRKLNKVNGNPGIVDMGAYENKFGQDPPPTCLNPTDGGSITGVQSGCYNFNPDAITNSTLPSGYLGDLEYKWQSSTNNVDFADIINSDTITYDPGALTQTTWYKRLSRVNCKTDWTGAAVSNVIEITVNPVPAVYAGGFNIICKGDSVEIPATVSGGTAPYTFLWTPSAGLSYDTILRPSTSPSITTFYTLLVTDANGCTVSDNALVVVNQTPVVNAGPDKYISSGNSTPLNASVSGGSPPNTYSWTPVTGLSNPAVLSPIASPLVTTTYILKITSSQGCKGYDTVVVHLNPPLFANITGTSAFACLGTIFSGADGNPGGGSGIYTSHDWSQSSNDGGSVTFSSPSSQTTDITCLTGGTVTITYTVTDNLGFSGFANTTITIYPNFVAGSISGYQSICYNTSPTLLTSTDPTGGNTPYSYQWQHSTNDADFSDISNATGATYQPGALTQTTYYRQIQFSASGCGTVITDTVDVTVYPEFVAGSVSASQSVCNNTIPALLTSTAPTGGSPPYNYQWQMSTDNENFGDIFNATGTSFQPGALTQTTYYRQKQMLFAGCATVTTDTVIITVNTNPDVYAGGFSMICSGDSGQILASVTGGSSPYTYLWAPSIGMSIDTILRPYVSPSASTSYTLTATDANGCTGTDVAHIIVAPVPIVNAGPDKTILPGTSTLLNATVFGGQTPYQYSWTPATGLSNAHILTPLASPLVTTTYILEVTGGQVCKGSDTVIVNVNPPLVANITGTSAFSCYGATFSGTDGNPGGGSGIYTTHAWSQSSNDGGSVTFSSPSSQNTDITCLTAGTVTVTYTVTDNLGFSGSANTTITIYPNFVAGSISANQTICLGISASQLNRTAPAGGNTPYSYQWQSSTDNINFSNINNATGATYQPGILVQTTYYRQIQTSASGCGSLTTNTVTITVNPRPTGVISGSAEICQGQPVNLTLQFTGTGPWSGALSDGSFFSSTNSTKIISKSPATTTTYTISSLNDANCTALAAGRTGAAIVTVFKRPTGVISGPQMVCYQQIDTLTIQCTGLGPWNGTLSDGTPFSGSNSTIKILIAPDNESVYTISTLNDSRCSATSADLSGSVHFTIASLPTSLITGDTTICNEASTLLLIYVTGTGPWYGMLSDGNPIYGQSSPIYRSVIPDSTFVYSVTYLFDGNICFAKPAAMLGVVTVGVNSRPTGDISGTASICHGESTDLTLHFTGNGPWVGTLSDGTSFSSSTATLTIPKIPSENSVYTISSLMDAHCASLEQDLTGAAVVTVHPGPTGVISGTTTICIGQLAELTISLTGSGTWGGSLSDGTVFSGNNNTITINVAPSATTVYSISTLHDSYCPATPNDLGSTATITVNPRPTGFVSGPASICAGQSAVMSISVTGTGPWTGTLSDGSIFSGSASPIVVSRSPLVTTTYMVATLNDANCAALPADLNGTVNVMVHSRPTGVISGTTGICNGQPVGIEIAVTGSGPWSGNLMNGAPFSGSSSPILINVIPSATTTFTIGSLNDANCIALPVDLNGSAKVTIKTRPTGVISGNTTICTGQNANLALTFSGKSPWSGMLSDGSSFTSTGNTLIINKSPSVTTIYTITSLSDGNCIAWGNDLSGSATITVGNYSTVTFTGLPAAICLYEGPVALTGGTPAGGVYSGPGVSGGMFYPLAAGAGTQILTYTNTSGGCTGSATAIIQVINSMKNEVTVGAGGDYTTLTGTTGVFNAINTHTLCGNLVVKILCSITEPGTVALNQWPEYGTGGYTVSIVPNNGTEKVLSGTYAGALIRLDRADRVIIDGRYNGQGMFLRWRNQHATNPTICLINDACNNTIRNCIIEGGNTTTSSGVLLLGTTNLVTGNDNNLITSNLIRNRSDAGGIPANLVYSSGTVGKLNSSNILTYNEFMNFSSTGVTVAANGNGDSWVVIGNSFYMDFQTPVSTAQTAINFIPGANSLSNMIGLNRIGGSAALCAGNAWLNSGSVTLKGIAISSNGTSVQGNEVKNITMTNTASPQFYGIDVIGGPFSIGNETGNVIGDAVTTNSIQLGGRGSIYGIRSLSTTGSNLITNNLVANLVVTGGSTTATANLYGIVFSCALVSKNKVYSLGTTLSTIPLNIIGIQNNGNGTITNQVSNNMVSLNGLSAQSALITGIQDMAAATGISKYFYNTVSIYGSCNISKNSYCFYRKNAVNTTLTNNLLSNTRSSGTSAQYAIYSMAGTPWSSNYNDLYTAATPLGFYNGWILSNLIAWQSISWGDYQSISVAPVFVSAINLHLTPANYLIDGKGTPLTLVTDDIDNQPRSVQPDIGADEFTAVYPRIDNEKPVLVTDLNIYPNPFSGMTNISYTLPEESSVNIAVYNLLGEKTAVIVESNRSGGSFSAQLNGNELLPGIYLCRMVVNGGKTIVKRIEVIK